MPGVIKLQGGVGKQAGEFKFKKLNQNKEGGGCRFVGQFQWVPEGAAIVEHNMFELLIDGECEDQGFISDIFKPGDCHVSYVFDSHSGSIVLNNNTMPIPDDKIICQVVKKREKTIKDCIQITFEWRLYIEPHISPINAPTVKASGGGLGLSGQFQAGSIPDAVGTFVIQLCCVEQQQEGENGEKCQFQGCTLIREK